MNTNIVISLDTRRSKSDGCYPLIMRLGHNERTTSIPLGIDLLKNDWDFKNKLVRKCYVGVNTVSRLNNMIQKKKAEVMDIIFKLHETNKLQNLSITDLRNKIVQQNKTYSFYEFAQTLIDELNMANRIGTARSYKGVVSVLKTFHGKKQLYFQDINYSFLTRFETNHRRKGNGANGLSVYMRAMRAIYNKAIKAGIVEKEFYPFTDYKIKTVPTEKRAVEWSLLDKIMKLNLSPNDKCFNSWNYFLASYMMYGMNFTDMAFLKKTDVKNGRIIYCRKKTSKIYDIKITKNLENIISFYTKENPDSEYIFPIIKRASSMFQDKDIQWARKRYNKKLKKIAEVCGIDQNLTSYVSRHSFATQAMLQQVPLNAISTMLGHSSLKTTEVYLKSLPSNILDDYNAKILQY